MTRPSLVIIGVAGAAHAVAGGEDGHASIRTITAADAAKWIDYAVPFVDLADPAKADRFLALIPRAPRLRFRGRAEGCAYAEVPAYVAFWLANGAKGAA